MTHNCKIISFQLVKSLQSSRMLIPLLINLLNVTNSQLQSQNFPLNDIVKMLTQ